MAEKSDSLRSEFEGVEGVDEEFATSEEFAGLEVFTSVADCSEPFEPTARIPYRSSLIRDPESRIPILHPGSAMRFGMINGSARPTERRADGHLVLAARIPIPHPGSSRIFESLADSR